MLAPFIPHSIIEHMPKVEVLFIGGIYFRKMTFPPDFLGTKEVHAYEHASICLQGDGYLLMGDETKPFKAGDIMMVKAGVEHRVVARTEVLWICVHSEGPS